jgi:beta-glucosidase
MIIQKTALPILTHSTSNFITAALFRRTVMLKKILGLIMLFSAGIFAVPTVIDSIYVPIKVIDGVGTNWTGKVSYWLTVGDNDSLNISLTIDPVSASSPTCTVTMDGDAGMFPMVNGMNGKRDIFFTATFSSAPTQTDQYTATVHILADMSNLERTARSMLGAIPLAQKCGMITGDGCFMTTAAVDTLNRLVAEFRMIDGPHGVNLRSTNACATLFPTEAASANAWDTSLTYRLGQAIAQEAKPATASCGPTNIHGQNVNLAPMLNVVRDPRGGRDFETWGEDPYLLGKLAASDIRGRQSQTIIATPKHFVCNDEELNRYSSTSNVDDTTLRQTYCYPFEVAIREAKPWALMAAYNAVNGTLCPDDTTLLMGIAKNEWGFRGMIMSDWYTAMNSSAIYSGCDIEMDENTVFGGICNGSVPQAAIDAKVLPVLRAKLWSGCVTDFSANTSLPSTVNSADHIALANEAAHKSIVLVKNDSVGAGAARHPILPIDTHTVHTVLVAGYYANLMRVGGAGPGTSSLVTPCAPEIVSPLAAIQAKIGAAKVVTTGTTADVVIVFVGVPSNGDNAAYEGHDRPSADLPVAEDGSDQNALVQSFLQAGKNTIVVLTGGAAVTDGMWHNASGVVVAFYPGQGQGAALADILFGDYNPCGKLTVSFPKNATDLPAFTNSQAVYQYERPTEGRGYPYYIAKGITPLIPFGYGLSYSTFTYSGLSVPPFAAIGAKVQVSVNVTNNGSMAGDEVVQLYLQQVSPAAARPALQLRGFARVTLNPGETKPVTFDLKEWDFAHWSSKAGWIVDPNSTYELSVRKNSTEPNPLASTITLE